MHKALSAIPLFLVFTMFLTPLGGGGGANCGSPPPNNPNSCHIYTWNSFPNNQYGVTPTTGLFNNDSSYVFSLNITSLQSYSMCANVQSDNGINDTLVLQYFNLVGNWVNIDNGIQAGSLATSGSTYPTTICSTTLGHIVANLAINCAMFPFSGGNGSQCSLRIAGNDGAVNLGIIGVTTLKLSELYVQFFYAPFSARNVITCTAISRSTTQFSNQCARLIASAGQSVTVSWEANNLGVTFQSGSVTCAFAAQATTCSNTITFSPAFATTPSVVLDWTPVAGSGTVLGTPGTIIPILS
jgi:hypothetical protein